MKDTVSIIVPIYNVERFLPECMESLLALDYPDLEIIAVNDGSTDRSGEIAREFVSHNHRIRLIEQENRGVSVARNTGVRAADGDLIMFVDSDDLVHPELLSHLLNTQREHDADIACCGFAELAETPAWSIGNRSQVFEDCDGVRNLLYQHIVNGPFAKLYRAEILGYEPFLPGMRVGEDLLMNTRVFADARRVAVSDARLYGYRQDRKGSVMSAPVAADRIKLIQELESLRGGDFDNALGNRQFMEALYVFFENDDVPRFVAEMVRRERSQVLRDSEALPNVRLYALATFIHPRFAKWLHRLR